jgi:hypothetical protein
VYKWELDKEDQSLAISVNGPLILCARAVGPSIVEYQLCCH